MPPERAPNVLLILTGDVGFAAPSTFGGVIPTPTLDAVAASGLRCTTFHTTALCSPTRAALPTRHNHHQVGFGNIGELSTGFPGYNPVIPRETARIGAIPQANGCATAWFGKNHNVPAWEASAAGPFANWPVGMGFAHFYGFVGGDTSQWQPVNLFRDTTPIHPSLGQPPGSWNLTTEALRRRALAAHPAEADPRQALALFLVRQGRAAESLPAIAEAAALAPAVPRHPYVQALVLQRLGRAAQAIAAIAALVARHPGDRDGLLALATFARDAGETARARRAAAALLALDPADRLAAALLAQLGGAGP